MKGQLDIYYDKEGDFLEITIVNPPNESYCEDIDEDIFLRKEEGTGDIIGIGILNFTERTKDLRDIIINAPVEVKFESLKDSIL